MPERGCEAEWKFDVDFAVMCHLPPHGPAGHRAEIIGNDGVTLTATWDDPRPALCDGTVNCQSGTGHTLCCRAASRRPS